MAHQVFWTEQRIQEFVALACLSEEEEKIIRMRAKNKPIWWQAQELGYSVPTINAKTALLKLKYDEVQPHSNVLEPRRFSAKETYKGEQM